MCGLAGVIGGNGAFDPRTVVERMVQCQTHRGPDDRGRYATGGTALGHTRLCVLDPSEAGHQPMRTPDGRYVLVYNGEVYNYRDLRAELQADGVSFDSATDSEVVLHALAEWGSDAVRRFRGMFAFAFYDSRERALLLGRDHMGIKPLYHYRDSTGALLFASEVRALLESDRVPRRLDRRVLPDFLSQQTVPAPDTLIEGIRALPPGHLARFDGDDLEVEQFAGLTDNTNSQMSGDESPGRSGLRKAMEGAVERRLVSDVPLGAFLSGGVDSTLIVGLMSRLAPSPPSTFTLTVKEHESEDVRYARMVADRFDTDHREVRVSEANLLEEVSDALSSQDHPTGDGLNTYLVSRAAREAGLTVALSGIGGDELFGGYSSTFRRMQLARRWRPLWKLMPVSLRRAIGNAVYSLHPTVTTAAFRDALASRGAPAEVYPVLRAVFYSSEIDGLLSDLPDVPKVTRRSLASLLCDDKERSGLEGATLAEMSIYMRDVLLRDADQMGMANSLEIRVPFLDSAVVSVALGLGDRARRPGGPPKRYLTDTFDDLIPREVAHRSKEGFTLPMKRWMSDELRAPCREAIGSLADHPAFAEDEVREVWDSFLDGDPRYTWSRPWLLVALGSWVRRHSLK